MAAEKFIRGKRDDCKHAGLYCNTRRLQEADAKLDEYYMERNRNIGEVLSGEIIPIKDIDPRDYQQTFSHVKKGTIGLHNTLDLGIYPFEGNIVAKPREAVELPEGVEIVLQAPAQELNYTLFEQ